MPLKYYGLPDQPPKYPDINVLMDYEEIELARLHPVADTITVMKAAGVPPEEIAEFEAAIIQAILTETFKWVTVAIEDRT